MSGYCRSGRSPSAVSRRTTSSGPGSRASPSGLALGLLCLEYAHLPVLRNILGGIAVTAAGLLLATDVRLLLPHRRRPAALVFAALSFGLIAFGGLPLLVVLFGLVPLSIAVAGVEAARAR